MNATAARVFLIDHHHALRQAVALLLDREADISVVGQSVDANGLLLALDALELAPNVLVIDAGLHDPKILLALADIVRAHPSLGVVFFTNYSSPFHVWSAVNAGARGYVLKSAESEELLSAVRSVARGGAYLQDRIVAPLLSRVVRWGPEDEDSGMLSMNQLRIVEALAEGKSNKMVAKSLSVTEETVKSHLKRIYERLGARDRASAVAIAFRHQMIR